MELIALLIIAVIIAFLVYFIFYKKDTYYPSFTKALSSIADPGSIQLMKEIKAGKGYPTKLFEFKYTGRVVRGIFKEYITRGPTTVMGDSWLFRLGSSSKGKNAYFFVPAPVQSYAEKEYGETGHIKFILPAHYGKLPREVTETSMPLSVEELSLITQSQSGILLELRWSNDTINTKGYTLLDAIKEELFETGPINDNTQKQAMITEEQALTAVYNFDKARGGAKDLALERFLKDAEDSKKRNWYSADIVVGKNIKPVDPLSARVDYEEPFEFSADDSYWVLNWHNLLTGGRVVYVNAGTGNVYKIVELVEG